MNSPENAPKAKRRWGMTDLSPDATHDISSSLTTLLADVFALYLKTKNFHLHLSGSHFRDYHLLLDEQGEQIFAMTDSIAERPRKIGGTTLRSIGHIPARGASPITMRNTWNRRTCWLSSGTTTSVSRRRCVKSMISATNTTIPRPPVSLKTGSTKLRVAPGSCTRRLGGLAPTGEHVPWTQNGHASRRSR
jgi:Ferritin-like domain